MLCKCKIILNFDREVNNIKKNDMKNLVIIALLLVGTLSFAQNKRALTINEETNLIEATFTNDAGEIVQEGTYNKAGQLHGDWITYNAEGKKTVSAKYNQGIKTGKWFFWTKDTLKEVDYSKNTIANVNVWKTDSTIADSRRP